MLLWELVLSPTWQVSLEFPSIKAWVFSYCERSSVVVAAEDTGLLSWLTLSLSSVLMECANDEDCWWYTQEAYLLRSLRFRPVETIFSSSKSPSLAAALAALGWLITLSRWWHWQVHTVTTLPFLCFLLYSFLSQGSVDNWSSSTLCSDLSPFVYLLLVEKEACWLRELIVLLLLLGDFPL